MILPERFVAVSYSFDCAQAARPQAPYDPLRQMALFLATFLAFALRGLNIAIPKDAHHVRENRAAADLKLTATTWPRSTRRSRRARRGRRGSPPERHKQPEIIRE